MKIQYFIPLVFVFSLLGCRRELTEGEKDQIKAIQSLETVRFECKTGYSVYNFKGFVNQNSLCYYDNADKYKMFNGIRHSSISGNTSSINPNSNNGSSHALTFEFTQLLDTDSNFTFIEIVTPLISDANLATPQTFIDSFFKESNLPILGSNSNEFKAFEISINLARPGKYSGHALINITTAKGDQTGSKLICTQKELKEELGKKYLDLTFEIDCKIYCNNYYTATLGDVLDYGRLKGVFKTKLYL